MAISSRYRLGGEALRHRLFYSHNSATLSNYTFNSLRLRFLIATISALRSLGHSSVSRGGRLLIQLFNVIFPQESLRSSRLIHQSV